MQVDPERLAYWFFRLNGFFTIPNLIVHAEGAQPDGSYGQRTEIDVLGVRFHHRKENADRPMQDYELFAAEQRTQVVLCEVKPRAKINGAWTNPALKNLEKVLLTGGFVPGANVDAVAAKLYECGVWWDDSISISMICLATECSRSLRQRFPAVHQLTWAHHVLPFIYNRFREYANEKRLHDQWENEGKLLFDLAMQNDEAAFIKAVLKSS